MIKILLTGDLHLGREYKKYGFELASIYSDARVEAFKNVIDVANKEKCEYLVIAGDLYDKTNITRTLHKQVSGILNDFEGDAVLIIPGNHDYYNRETDDLWKKFEEVSGSNVKLFKDNTKIQFGDIVFYPCICHDKRSNENSLGWLKDEPERADDLIHIGIAHGAIEGVSFDNEKEYYYMTKKELLNYNMDAWLIGHTHTSYPENLGNLENNRIFNAGTHQQTDFADNSKSVVFVLEIDDDKKISAKEVKTGMIDFVRKDVKVKFGEDLREKLLMMDHDPPKTSLRVNISGVVSEDEYLDRIVLYEDLRDNYLHFEPRDEKLKKRITVNMVNEELAEGSIINKLLNLYGDENNEEEVELLNLAYDLVTECREGK